MTSKEIVSNTFVIHSQRIEWWVKWKIFPPSFRVGCWITMLASRWDIAANKQRIEMMAPTWHHQNAALWNWILTILVGFKGSLWDFFATFEGNNETVLLVLKSISSVCWSRMLRTIIFFHQFKVVQISLPTILQHFNQCFVFCQFCDVTKVAIVGKKRKML